MPSSRTHRSWPRFSAIQRTTLALIFVALAALAALSGGQDFDLEFNRDVPWPRDVAIESIQRYLGDLKLWPRWFYGLEEARYLADVASGKKESPAGREPVMEGQDLRLYLNPQKGPHRHYEIDVRIERFEPGRLLKLRVLSDSKKKLSPLFDSLSWQVEITADHLNGKAWAHTAHWRSRLFGRIADQILLNQVFYPDLFRLARADQPDAIPAGVLIPDSGQGR